MANTTPWARWYWTQRWRKLRAWQLGQEPLCRMHAAQGHTVAADTVDHVRAHKGDASLFWDAGNLQSLCRHCHDSMKATLERGGHLPGCDPTGRPIDPHHHWNEG